MGKINTFLEIIKNNPSQLGDVLAMKMAHSKIFYGIPDVVYLKIQFFLYFRKRLNLKNPKTFNEKLQWLKLYYRNDAHCQLVDKYEVKKYVSDCIGDKYIIPTYGVWNSVEEIGFQYLPDKYVLKCTHDSGSVIIVKNKNDIITKNISKQLKEHLQTNLYYFGREWPYKSVKPRIIAEECLGKDTEDVRDYKFFCFSGIVKCFKVDFNRFTDHKANYYDRHGKLLDCGEVVCPPDYNKKIDMPKNLKEMIYLAEKLSKNFPFMRVDFYNIGNKIYFGELTFFPASGFGKFTDIKWDFKLGEWIKLDSLMTVSD